MEGVNLAWTEIIHDRLLYVSTAVFYDYYKYPLEGDRFETCIFSQIPNISFNIIFHKNIKNAVKVHNYIVNNLRKKLGITV